MISLPPCISRSSGIARIAAVLMTITVPTLVGCASGADYSTIMTTAVERALGHDYDAYQPFTYPTDNFGLGTAYSSTGSLPTLSPADFVCDMWYCIGIQPPSDEDGILRFGGFAAVGKNGAQVSLSESEEHDLAFNALLPKIFQVLKITGGFSSKDVVETHVTIGSADPRLLRPDPYVAHIDSLNAATSMLKSAFDHGTLSLVVADVVIDHLTVTIKSTSGSQTKLDAALDSTKHPVQIQGGELSFSASSDNAGTYTFETTQPVIVRRYVRRQEAAGTLARDTTWSEWTVTRPEIPASGRQADYGQATRAAKASPMP